MLSSILDALLDALLDSLQILPFLFLAYLFIEFIEHRASQKLILRLTRLGRFGPVCGAVSWLLPHFTVAASNLYAGRIISFGMLLSIFISTSDEALTILITQPNSFGTIWRLVLIKIIIAVAAGFIADIFIRDENVETAHTEAHEHLHKDCDHDECGHGILKPSIKHTLQSYLFVLISLCVINLLITWIGQENIGSLLDRGLLLNPLLACLIGLIPSCASSIILTEFYLGGILSFGSYISGLITTTGIAYVVMVRSNPDRTKRCLQMLAILLFVALLSGYVIQLFT